MSRLIDADANRNNFMEIVYDILSDEPDNIKANIIIEAFDIAIEALKEPERKWIPVSERLPNMEEYLENDGRFILDDGNRRYQGLFDIYDKKFKFSKHLSGLSYELIEDNCVIAWQPLPEPYKVGEQE